MYCGAWCGPFLPGVGVVQCPGGHGVCGGRAGWRDLQEVWGLHGTLGAEAWRTGPSRCCLEWPEEPRGPSASAMPWQGRV